MDGNSAGTPSPTEATSQSTDSNKIATSPAPAPAPAPATAAPAGCGCASHPSASNVITVSVTPTTGGQFDLKVGQGENVENLKKLISKKLKVPKERICLLHRERQLRDGTLEENQVMDGSRLTLLPSVETGLLAQRPEQSVMQALESLNDNQVNDFLSGKAPLNLTMRLGDHMMLIQLQLSTVSPQASRSRLAGSGSSGSSSSNCHAVPSLRAACGARARKSSVLPGLGLQPKAQQQPQGLGANAAPHAPSEPRLSVKRTASQAAGLASIPSLSSTISSISQDPLASLAPGSHACEALLSQLVDSATAAASAASACVFGGEAPAPSSSIAPVATSVTAVPRTSSLSAAEAAYRTVKPPSEAPVMSATYASAATEAIQTGVPTTPTSASSPPSPVSPPSSPSSPASPPASPAAPPAACPLTQTTLPTTANASTNTTFSTSTGTNTNTCSTGETICTCDALRCPAEKQATLDTRALAEASRNLTQTLKQLSSEVLTTRTEEDPSSARRRQGAIIESMHHHGKGVYSGTFSGTLNPALQDRYGRPKRDISTVIHILNDLLCATPQYRRHARSGQTSSFVLEAPTSPSPSSPGSASCPTSPSPAGTASPAEAVDTTTTTSCPAQQAHSRLPEDDIDTGVSQQTLENQATRGKMERLRLVMEERRERRRARREARHSPYAAPQPQHWSAKSETQPTNAAAAGAAEAMDTEQPLCELSPPEPVVA